MREEENAGEHQRHEAYFRRQERDEEVFADTRLLALVRQKPMERVIDDKAEDGRPHDAGEDVDLREDEEQDERAREGRHAERQGEQGQEPPRPKDDDREKGNEEKREPT